MIWDNIIFSWGLRGRADFASNPLYFTALQELNSSQELVAFQYKLVPLKADSFSCLRTWFLTKPRWTLNLWFGFGGQSSNRVQETTQSCSNSPVQSSSEPVTAVKGARNISNHRWTSSNHRWTTSNRSPRAAEVDGAVWGVVNTFEPVLRGQAGVTSNLIRKSSEITEVMEDIVKTGHLNPTRMKSSVIT